MASVDDNIVDIFEPYAPYEGEGPPSTFPLLSIAEIEALPPPRWLVHEAIAEDGISIIYGDPGAGKSFVALDMSIRIALGIDWFGRKTQKTGVLYIAGEGSRGVGKRLTGWRIKHGLDKIDAPFMLLPMAVQFLEADDVNKLLRTIDEAMIRAAYDIGLIVIDTVSRSIAGQDENGQETMSAFVKACDKVRSHCGGAIIGIHHSGKDKERGMRGSTVLLGACDAAIRLSKSERTVTLEFEKQKDAEEARPVFINLEPVFWDVGNFGASEEISTLVPVLAERSAEGADVLSMMQIREAFAALADAWAAGKPLSNKPQTRSDGRYAPLIFSIKLGGSADVWKEAITQWLANDALEYEMYDKKTKRFGIRVLNPIL